MIGPDFSSSPDFKLATQDRLLDKRDFARLRHGAQSLSFRDLVVYLKPNDLGRSRVGITLKIRGQRAVDRNRARRWVRESFRTKKPQLGGFDYNVVLYRLDEGLQSEVNRAFHALVQRVTKS